MWSQEQLVGFVPEPEEEDQQWEAALDQTDDEDNYYDCEQSEQMGSAAEGAAVEAGDNLQHQIDETEEEELREEEETAKHKLRYLMTEWRSLELLSIVTCRRNGKI